MDDKIKRVLSSAPMGNVTPMGRNGYGEDEGGRIFRVTSVEQLEAIRKKREIGKDRRHFSFTHMQNIREITGDLSNIYCGYIVMLQPYIEWQTNRLTQVTAKGIAKLQRKQLANILCVSDKTVRTVVNELKEREILFEHEDRSFTINERYHFRKKAGAEADMLIKTFFTSLKKFNVKPADLGFVYKLLPYVHYTTNMVCINPNEKTPENVQYLNLTHISEKVGMHAKQVSVTIGRLIKAGVIRETINDRHKRESFITLNPYVFYRKKGRPEETLRGMFAAHAWE